MPPPLPFQPTSLPPASHVARVRALYDAGQFCSAWDALRAERPVEAWTSVTERILLARVLMQIGSSRRSRRELLRAWEENPADAEACQYHAMTLLQRRGPLAAMQFMDAAGSFETASEELRADWLLTRSNVSGALRDFVQAERWQRAAEALSPTHPWLWVQRAHLRMQGDAFAEAETWARKSLSLQPWYRPAVQQLAHLLQLQSRDQEALALLKEASQRLESASLLGQLSTLQGELGDDEGALHSLWRALELSPGLERRGFEWFAGALSDASYKLGDRARAVELAELSTHPWMKKVAARMATATDLRRVVLPVPFVRQHHVTCAPATLSALSAFWKMPADHVSVAEEICYDGTPARSERKWGSDHGFIAREFTVDWDSAVALLERGIPFTLTTTETSTAHLQAIVGFDASRRTFLIRDPSHRFLGEGDADAMFERYLSTGPRGMVLLPIPEAARLEGISLPDATLYDDLFAIQMALEAHDRARAGELQARMAASAPDHRLTIDAMLSLAGYDADRRARLRCAEQLVARYPDVPRLALMKASYSQDLISEPDRVAALEALALKPKAEPDVLLAYATELSGDARRLPEADFLLRRAVRKSPESAQGYATLARVRYAQGRREEALVLRRAAACLAHKNERNAYQYFAEAQALGRVDEALAFLDDRFQRFGHKSGAACETLVSALTAMDRTGDALNVLELGLQRARDDGDLRLAGIQTLIRAGKVERAGELLEEAQGKVRRLDWLRGAARLARARLDFEGAIARWREVLELDPVSMDAHSELCRLLTRGDGPARAIEHLAAAVERFPHHVPLHEAQLMWSRDHDLPRAEAIARRLLTLNPTDAWTRRELAICLARQRRFDEAFTEMETARQVEPANPASYSVHASLRELSGDLVRARELCREALRLEPDEPSSIHRLVQLAPTLEERRAALDFIGDQLDRSPLHHGEGALAYQELAEGVSDNGPLLARLRGWMQTKPGSWAACTALARQLVEARQYDESLAVSQVLVERFPLLPGSWLQLAYAHRVLQDAPAEEQALRRALELNPEWGTSSWLLARLLKRQGDFGGAEQVLERASRYAADDGAVHSELAELLWLGGRRDEALERVERALRADPSQRQAWSRLDTWATEHGDPTRSERMARQVIAELPASHHGWFALSCILPDTRGAERMAALEEAITRAPRAIELLDTRAMWLTESHRFEEALTACRPAVFGDRPPRELLARAAWIRWQRGEQEEALAAITALCQADPTFAWAAALRAEWTHSLGRTEEALAAAARLVELEPLQARSHGYLADARRLANDRVGAVEAFTEAVRIAPGYVFAVQSLLDLYLELERWDEASALLQRSEGHVDPAILRAREAQFSCTVGDWTAAKDALVRLLVDSPNETSLHATAIESLEKASRTDLLREALEEAMAAKPSATLGQHWGLFLAKHVWTPGAWGQLDRLRGLEDLGPAAVAAYLEHLGERGAGWTVRLYLRFRLGDLLRLAVVFGAVTYALVKLRRYAQLLSLCHGWPLMEGLRPWMLSNLMISARRLGRRPLAAALSEAALKLPLDHFSQDHRVWLAHHRALEGRNADAQALLADVSLAEDQKLLRFLKRLAEALTTDPVGEAMKKGESAFWMLQSLAMTDPLWQRVFNETLWVLARRKGGVSGWAWWLKYRAMTLAHSGNA